MSLKSREGRRALAFGLVVAAFAAACFFGYQEIRKVEDQGNELAALTHETRLLTQANHNLTTSLQAALVESCDKNGNAARQVTRETLHEEIHSARHPDKELVEALQIPPGTLERVTRESVERLKDRLARVKPVDCADQYHISPGSGARRRAH